MQIAVCPSGDEAGKFRGVVQMTPGIWSGSVLDVGSRSGVFGQMLPASVTYRGFDQTYPADIIGNLEQGLPFRDQSYDIVVALDVLEHTNDIHGSFAELCRVSRHYVVIALPNLYEIRARIKMLLGKRPSGKYGLPSNSPADRHRWFFPFDEAIRFTHDQLTRTEFKLLTESYLVGPKRGTAPMRFMARTFPSLIAAWYVAVLSRER